MSRRFDDSDLDDYPRPRRRRPQKKSDSNTVVVIVAIIGVAILLLGGGLVGGLLVLREQGVPRIEVAGNAPASDLDLLAGSWESTFRDAAGRITMHKVKEINGNTETATWYRPDGTVFRVNRVEFRLLTRGQNKVFSYFNGWVLNGPDAGQRFPSGEYVYTLEGDTWTEFDPGGVIVWTRRR